MAGDNDFALMLAFKGGDVSAFEEIISRNKTPVLNTIYRFIGDRSEAEDLAQEVFVRVYKSRDRYRPDAKFSTWLYTITSNLCISFLRKKKILRILSLDALWNADEDAGAERPPAELPDAPDKNPETAHLMAEERMYGADAVKKALLKLPARQRLAVVLRYYNDYSYDEIADVLKTSIQSVKSLLFRATNQLKNTLKT
jgi:RNA polymerase sigma-70 factor (ECF subfamily)